MAIVKEYPLFDKKQTGKAMHWLIDQYNGDLDKIRIIKGRRYMPLSKLNVKDFFNFVRKISYRKDQSPREYVARPAIILRNKKIGMDCKKKAILIGSYLKRNKIPYRLIASSRKRNKKIHHVFPQMKLGNDWVNMDATYKHYKPFEPKFVTKFEVLK